MHPRIPVLLITTQREWSLLLEGQLAQSNFALLTPVRDGSVALDLFYQTAPHLVLMDLHLPDESVVDLCIEMLLVQPETRIVLVTDSQSALPLLALQAGVSGCVRRDLPGAAWPGLLTYILDGGLAFERTLMEGVLDSAWLTPRRQPHMTIGSLRIDLARRLVLYGGRRVQLTPREFALLTCLAQNKDRVLTFDQLLSEAWGYDVNDGTPAQVRLYVARLRRKLMDQAQTPDFILTEWGVGYRLHSEALRRPDVHSTPAAHDLEHRTGRLPHLSRTPR
jgi:DNA-binding response OmpR family regulator